MTRMGIFAVSHTHQVYMHDGTDGKGPPMLAEKSWKARTNRRGSRTTVYRHLLWPVTSRLDRSMGGQRTRGQPFTGKRLTSNTRAPVHGKTFDVENAVQRSRENVGRSVCQRSAVYVMNGPFVAPRRRMRRPEESERDLRRSRTDLARFLGKDWCTKPRGFPPNLQLRRTAIRFWSGFPIGTLAQDWDSFAFKSGTWRPKVGHFPAYFARLTCFLTI